MQSEIIVELYSGSMKPKKETRKIREFLAFCGCRVLEDPSCLPDAFGFHSDSLPDLNTAAIVPRHKIAVRAKAKLLELYVFRSVDLLHLRTATWAKQRSHKGQTFNRSMFCVDSKRLGMDAGRVIRSENGKPRALLKDVFFRCHIFLLAAT